MKKIHLCRSLRLLIVLLPGIAGCGKPAPEPPLMRSDLVLRFFDSMKNRDYHAAEEQLGKLRALGAASNGLATLENSVRFNALISDAQALIDADRLQEARALLDSAREKSAANQRLLSRIDELDKLIALRREVGRMRDAKLSPEERRNAVEQVEILLHTYPPAEILRSEVAAQRIAIQAALDAEAKPEPEP